MDEEADEDAVAVDADAPTSLAFDDRSVGGFVKRGGGGGGCDAEEEDDDAS